MGSPDGLLGDMSRDRSKEERGDEDGVTFLTLKLLHMGLGRNDIVDIW